MNIDKNELFSRRDTEDNIFSRRDNEKDIFSRRNEVDTGIFVRRLNVNTLLSNARIFDEESNDSIKEYGIDNKNRKAKITKKNVKGSPYKTNLARKNIEYENDAQILARRQKQIDYGKNTVSYDNYRATVPMNKRTKEHPKTPVKHLKYSRRAWDSLIRIWRMKLHEYDTTNTENESEDMNDLKMESDSSNDE